MARTLPVGEAIRPEKKDRGASLRYSERRSARLPEIHIDDPSKSKVLSARLNANDIAVPPPRDED